MTWPENNPKNPEVLSKELEEKATNFIAGCKETAFNLDATQREEGEKLSQKCISKSMDLQYSRGTEFSPHIEKLILAAAKIAYIVYGPNSDKIGRFEEEVYYYKNFPDSSSTIVKEYDAFKKTIPV